MGNALTAAIYATFRNYSLLHTLTGQMGQSHYSLVTMLHARVRSVVLHLL